MNIQLFLALLFSQAVFANDLCAEGSLPAEGSLQAEGSLPAEGSATEVGSNISLSDERVRLTTAEIMQYFSNVRDQANVQDSVGTSAVNFWHADGRFENKWTNKLESGTVTGRWRAQNDKRCVLILSGLRGRNGVEICSPVYRSGEEFFSINSDGSIHGIHTLSPIE